MITANLSKDRDAKLQGLPIDGSQLPNGHAFFVMYRTLLNDLRSILNAQKLYTTMANLSKGRDAKL